ncbi:MAG: hypothetical protein J5586_03130 [Clostridia bacterium]|nr:hypothetical protein [Clostridia bacterium]
MKLCKKILAVIIVAAMLTVSFSALAAYEPEYPETPEGYDGYVTFAVSAITMGWSYLIDPVLIPFHEGESVAAITVRAFEQLGWAYTASGSVESGFYLSGVGCYETEPMIPDYLMEQILAYPAWSDEQYDFHFGEWTGEYTDDEILSAEEYCTLSGWMFLDNDELGNVGADAQIVEAGHVYTWIFSVYGWGMDYGVSDGWGSFPTFDNPMEGVSRTRASEVLALLSADEEMMENALDIAGEEFIAFLMAFYDPTSSQELIDETLAALLEALDTAGYELGDIDMNGEITTADAIILLRYVMGLMPLDDAALALADMNGDGDIDTADALLVLRAATL